MNLPALTRRFEISARRAHINMLGRPVQTLLRNFPWPIKKAILNATPLRSTRKGSKKLLIVGTPDTWLDSLWSAYSWLYFTDGALRLTVVVDGDVTMAMSNQFERLFPESHLRSAKSYADFALSVSPELIQFYNNNVFGRKLTTLISESLADDILYSDSDVLIFKKPESILRHLGDDWRTPLYIKGRGGHAWNAPRILDLMRSISTPSLEGFNSGLMYIPKGALDIELCRKCLKQYPDGTGHHFIEQSTFNALLSQARAKCLDPVAYNVSEKGMYFWERDLDYTNVVMRHFVGVVRHKMYTNGIPIVSRAMQVR